MKENEIYCLIERLKFFNFMLVVVSTECDKYKSFETKFLVAMLARNDKSNESILQGVTSNTPFLVGYFL